MDRVPTENGPSGHDLPMCLESTFNIFQPLWQRLASEGWLDEPEMSKVKDALGDLGIYNTYQVEIDSAWVKLSVADCVVLEKAWVQGLTVALHGYHFNLTNRSPSGNAFITSAVDGNGTSHRVRRSEYQVKLQDGGGHYERGALVEMVKGQLSAGLKKGYSKFLELHSQYHNFPVALNFLFTTMSQGFASFVIDTYKRHRGGFSAVEGALAGGTNAFKQRSLSMTATDLSKYESSLVQWVDHLGLAGDAFEPAWLAAASSPSSEVKGDFPEFFARVKQTAGALGHTSYVAETLWAMQRQLESWEFASSKEAQSSFGLSKEEKTADAAACLS